MKNIYGKIFYYACAVTVVLSSFCGCGKLDGEFTHPEFRTEYTIEEHIERIEKRTQEKFFEEILTGEISNIEVEILYAFYDNDPEYFMVQLEYVDEFEGDYTIKDESGKSVEKNYTTKYNHFIGFIEDDTYYVRVKLYSGYAEKSEQIALFIDGRNPYELSGYSNAKKYCSNYVCAVQTTDGLLQIFNATNLNREECGVEFSGNARRFQQRIIDEDEQKRLMPCYHNGFFNCLY
ncbi:MAG: hypothetical protein J6B56_01895 [Clostridia bacterium]|nr:hypothetical protein [Clostridia bacterium]